VTRTPEKCNRYPHKRSPQGEKEGGKTGKKKPTKLSPERDAGGFQEKGNWEIYFRQEDSTVTSSHR
jgi:hypothetical protein